MDHYGDGPFWGQGNIYEDLLFVLTEVTRLGVTKKNVALMSEACLRTLADEAAEALELADHYGLINGIDDARQRAANAVNDALDRYYLMQVGAAIAFYFDMPKAAPSYAGHFAACMLEGLRTRPAGTTCVWEAPIEYAARLLCTMPPTSVTETGPDGLTATVYKRFWKVPREGDAPPSDGGRPPPPWRLASELHRPSAEGPALHVKDARGEVIGEVYAERGERHRDPAQGPAYFERVTENGRVRFVTEYWADGIMHRPSDQGPAVIETDANGRVLLEVYMEQGKKHRDPAKGPARFEIEEIGGEASRFIEYCWQGELHRPSADGPAVLNTDAQDRVRLEIYIEHGKHHRDPKSGPAWMSIEEGVKEIRFMVEGALHRDEADGPACIRIDEATGAPIYEEYSRDGLCHRLGGPAEIFRDADKELRHEHWWRDGRRHRDPDEGPAVIYWKAGKIYEQERWVEGELMEEERVDAADGEADCA